MKQPTPAGGAEEASFRSLLRLTQAQQDAILEEFDRSDRQFNELKSRCEPRTPFRPNRPVHVIVYHPGGGIGRFEVQPVNISSRGICFLHGGFLYRGSRCRVMLPRRKQETALETEGHVMWCRHCVSACHAVGVRFASAIDIRPFVDIEQFAGSVVKTQVAEPAKLVGRVVSLDDQPIDRELMAMALSDTGLTLKEASSVDEAVRLVRDELVDLVMMELDLRDCRGEEAIARLRDAGFRRPIIAVTTVTDSERLAAATSAGCTEVLHKPYEPAVLLSVIAQQLANLEITFNQTPLMSALDEVTAQKRHVSRYVQRAKEAAEELERAIPASDFAAARSVCQTLRTSAEAYGFPMLSTAAKAALSALDASQSVEESRDELRRVVMVAGRLAA